MKVCACVCVFVCDSEKCACVCLLQCCDVYLFCVQCFVHVFYSAHQRNHVASHALCIVQLNVRQAFIIDLPSQTGFLNEMSTEVTDQAFRLGSHPSLVIWGGSNENEVALNWFEESWTNRDLYVADFAKLYQYTGEYV